MSSQPSKTGGRSLLLRFSDEEVREAERVLGGLNGANVETVSTNEVFRALRSRDGRLADCSHLGIVGDPPADGIGYSLAPILAAYARPRRVTLIDRGSGRAATQGLARYLAGAAGAGALQLAASGAAVGAQMALARRLLSGVGRVDAPARAEVERVLYIRPLVGVPAGVGGSISHTHGVIRAFRELGVALDPLTNDPSIARTAAADPDPPCEWRVVSVPRPLKAVPASTAFGADLAIAAAGVNSARAADAIYQRHARFTLVGGLLALITDKPLILEYNGSEAFFDQSYHSTPFAKQLLLCEDAILAAATVVIVTSQVDYDDLVARGVEERRIVLNPNGVDAQRFARGGGAEVRRRHGLEDADPVLGFVGSFGPWHGAPNLAEAFGRLAQKVPAARLLLVGDGPEQRDVRAVLERAGVADRALFVGKIAPAEVPAHLDACDILVSPHAPMPGGQEFFGSPTKLFEYMAAGRGIVASALGQIADVLDHEETALLVTPGDVDDLTAGIERLAGDRELRERLGAAARERALAEHSWVRNVERTLAGYASLAAPG